MFFLFNHCHIQIVIKDNGGGFQSLGKISQFVTPLRLLLFRHNISCYRNEGHRQTDTREVQLHNCQSYAFGTYVHAL